MTTAVRSHTTDRREAALKKRGSRMNESMDGWLNEWIKGWRGQIWFGV